MKKFLLFIILFVTNNMIGQTETRTINSADFPVALYSGIPEISIPLFPINTANNNFSIDLKVVNSLYAGTSGNFSTGDMGDAWSLNSLANITVVGIEEGALGRSWTVYDETTYSDAIDYEIDYEEGSTVYNYSIFGLTGKFVIIKKGTNFYPRFIEKNDYAEVTMDYTVTGDLFRLNSFTITDKNGFSYFFSEYARANHHLTYKDKTTFYISSVKDKNNQQLLTYNYSAYGNDLESIDVLNQGKLTISPLNPTSNKKTITYTDLRGNVNQKIEFYFFQMLPYNKLMMNQVRIYENGGSSYKKYTISYKRHTNIDIKKNYYGFLHDLCAYRNITPEKTFFDHGAVEKITTPEGATTFYEYEPNTVGLGVSGLTPGGEMYKHAIRSIRDANNKNYTYEPIPLTYNSTYGGYLVDLEDFFPFSLDHEQIFYLEYKVDRVEILPPSSMIPNGKYHTPSLKVGRYWTVPTLGLSPEIINPETCDPGQIIAKSDVKDKFLLKIEPEYKNYYQYVRAYYKKYKQDHEFSYYVYAPASRIKHIKSFSKPTVTITSNENVVAEQLFKYDSKTQSNGSSGYSKYFQGSAYYLETGEKITKDYKLYNYTDLILYKNVTVETPGIGKTSYEFNSVSYGNDYYPEDSNKVKFLKKIDKYNLQDQLIETTSFERTFVDAPLDKIGNRIRVQPVITYERVMTESFENGVAQGLKMITESTFDTLTRNLTQRKITDLGTNQTFEEQYTYQKLGNAYYQTQVEKFKNTQPLNRSTFEYQQNGTTQAYNLTKTFVAKSTLPLEIEKEITKYDGYGNVLEYKTKDGTVVSQLWGYNGTKLVAELKNVSYSTIASHISAINLYSNSGVFYNENNLIAALDALRNAHPNAFVTTYTYKPLVGISSVTDVNGRKETYQYDSFNRLWRVLNHEGLIIKEYEYNIKN